MSWPDLIGPSLTPPNVDNPFQGPVQLSAYEQRIQALMAGGMTRAQAEANQAYAVGQGADLDGDGAVTGSEWSSYSSGFAAGETSGVPDDLPQTQDEIDADQAAEDDYWDVGGMDGDPLTPVHQAGDVETEDGTVYADLEDEPTPADDFWATHDAAVAAGDILGGAPVSIPQTPNAPAGGSSQEGNVDAINDFYQGALPATDPGSEAREQMEEAWDQAVANNSDPSGTDVLVGGNANVDPSQPFPTHGPFDSTYNPFGLLAGVEDVANNQSQESGVTVVNLYQQGLNLNAQAVIDGTLNIEDVDPSIRDLVQAEVDQLTAPDPVDDALQNGDFGTPAPDDSGYTDADGNPLVGPADPNNSDPLPEITNPVTGEVINIVGDLDQVIIGDDDGLIVDVPGQDNDGNPVSGDGSGDGDGADSGGNNGGNNGGNPTNDDTGDTIGGMPDLGGGITNPNEHNDADPTTAPDDLTPDEPEPVTEPEAPDDEPPINNDPPPVDTGGGIDIPPVIPDIPDIIDDGNDNEGDDVSDDPNWLEKAASSVSSVLQTDVGNSSIGDILSGGINFYGQQEAAEAYERSADKALEWQKQLSDYQDPYRKAGQWAAGPGGGLVNRTNRQVNADPRETLNPLDPTSNARGEAGADPEAFGGFENLREFEGQTGDWNYGQIERGSDEWSLMTDDAVRMAENASKARGRLSTQEAKDSAFKSYIRAQGDIEDLNTSRLNQEMSRRGYDRDTAAGQRSQEAGEQLSASQEKFKNLSENRDRAFKELFADDTAEFERSKAANEQKLQERNQYWQELLGEDQHEWQKFFEVARLGQSAASGSAAAATNASNIYSGQAGVNAASTAGGYEALANMFSSNPYGNASVETP